MTTRRNRRSPNSNVSLQRRRDDRIARAFTRKVARQFRRELTRGLAAVSDEVGSVDEAAQRFLETIDVAEWDRLFTGLWLGPALELWGSEQAKLGVARAPTREDLNEMRVAARRHAATIVANSVKQLLEEVDSAQKAREDAGRFRRIVRGLYRRFGRQRAARIALNATLQATSQVQHLAVQAAQRVISGVIMRVWNTVGDDRVRDVHAEADGQETTVDGTFNVGGEQLQRPRDPAGSPWNILNCRCWTTSVIRDV